MKKLLVALVALFCVNAVSAQVSNVGLRVSGGIDLVGHIRGVVSARLEV